jgi:anti-anti-sigma regulatory factor
MNYWAPKRPSIDFVVAGDDVLIKLSGTVDVSSRDEMKAAFYLAMVTARNVVLDAAELAVVDAGTVMLLSQTADHLSKRGRSLHVVNPRPSVRQLLITLHQGSLVADPHEPGDPHVAADD